MSKKSISYSQYTSYANCPRKWKLDYIDGLNTYQQTIHTVFGTSIHRTLQNYLDTVYNKSVKEADCIDLNAYLKDCLVEEYGNAVKKNNNVHFSTAQELGEFYEDGVAIVQYFRKNRRGYFSTKNTKLVGIEIALNLPLTDHISFKGFLDIVMHHEPTDTYHILDFKTSTQGWNKHQKADKTKTAQLVLYKDFYAKQLGIDPEQIQVEYIILRRKINENLEFKPKRIQTFSPASGKPTRNKINKALMEFVHHAFTPDGDYNREAHYPAISSSGCKYCPYNNEEALCPKKNREK